MSFVSLHNHSDHSLRDGFQSVETMLQYASSLGQKAIALTDHGTMSGCGEGFRLHKKYDIKFIAGCEHYLCSDVTIKDKSLQHICLLAMNDIGYRNLNILTTIAHSEKCFYSKPRIDLNLLAKYNEGLICTTACLAGCQNKIPVLKQIFGDRLYVEIHTNQIPEQKTANVQWLKLAEKYDVPVYVAVDAHYTLKKQAPYQDMWTPYDYKQPPDFYMHTEEEVYNDLNYLPYDIVHSAVELTSKVADRCTFDIVWGENHYPKSRYDDPMEEIVNRTWEGFNVHGITADQKHIDQVKHELEVLKEVDYLDYFLIVDDMLRYCHDNNIRTGIGRGSIVGSDVAYNMGITGVDPIKNGLIFERFAHTERVTPPDIDTDVPRSRRGDVIQYLKDTYGYVYQVVTFNKMADKSAVRRAGQSCNIELGIVNDICNNINVLEDLPGSCPEKFKDKFMPSEWDWFLKTCYQFRGKLQNFGTHASAVVVITTDPYNFCAIERFSGSKGPQYNLNYDYHDLESMGLLKLDILGLETLDILDRTLEQLPEEKRPDLNKLPEDDVKTYKLLNSGYTAGLFQLEGRAVSSVMKEVEPHTISDLTAIVALGRPGPMSTGMTNKFIANKREFLTTGQIDTDNKDISKALEETFDTVIYQEQVMALCQIVWGMSLGEADMIRRAIGRKDKKLMDELVEKLSERENIIGLTKGEIFVLLHNFEEWSSYLFNKSHAAAYAYTAYQTAYLKAHFPLEFYVSLLNSNIDQEKALEYIAEIKSRGIEVKMPDIFNSEVDWKVKENSIIAGFAFIKGVGRFCPLTRQMYRTGQFEAFIDENRASNKRVLQNLVKAGCFKEDPMWAIDYIDWFKEAEARKQLCLEKIDTFSQLGATARVKYWENELTKIPDPPDRKNYHTPPEQIRAMQIEVLGSSTISIFDDYDMRLVGEWNKIVWINSISKKVAKASGKKMIVINGTTPCGDYKFIFYDPDKKLEEKLDTFKKDCMVIVRVGRLKENTYFCKDIVYAKKKQ